MKKMGYGAGYRYPHDYPQALVPQEYLPEALKGHRFYQPTDRGMEKTIKARLEYWRKKLNQEKA
jgi:putative ATPase